MKKIALSFLLLIAAIVASNEANAAPRPLYVGVRLGIFAKWQIVIGECQPGWGICISLADNTGQNFLGYDDSLAKFTIKVSKKSPEAKNFLGGTFEIKEDSPIDPKVIQQLTNLKTKDKIYVIKKGVYPVSEDSEFYIVDVNYYIQ